VKPSKSRTFLIALSVVVGTGCFTPFSYAANDSNLSKAAEPDAVESKSKRFDFMDMFWKKMAKQIMESTSERSPLTAQNQKSLIEYYAEQYFPKHGCSLLELPPDSDLDYVPPKPQPKPSSTPQQTSSSSQETTTSQPTQPTQSQSISMTHEEREWLEKLVQAEAGGEPYEGKIAVATVIANRVESTSFPNTVMGVIKANNGKFHQFSPWDDGSIYKVTPSEETKQAVHQVFDKGVRNLPEEATYFAMSNIAFDNWIGKTRKFITSIGNHSFFSQYEK